MIYVRTEDSKDGLELCKKIIKIYFPEFNINIDTLGGIINLKNKVSNLLNIMSKDDKLIIIYDNITENVLVAQNINSLLEFIKRTNEHRVKMIPTISFELEVLSVKDIEYMYNIEIYNEWFGGLRNLYNKTKDIRDLTYKSKEDKAYKEMYSRARKEKYKSKYYKVLTEQEFEDSITIESISKYIINLIFDRSDIRPIRDCWANGCCYKNSECAYTNLDIDKIKQKEFKGEHLYKIRVLAWLTSYRNLIIALNKLLDTDINIDKSYQIADIIKYDTILQISIHDLEALEAYKKIGEK